MSKSVKNSSREITLYGDSCMINHELNTGYLLAGCDLFLDYIVDNDETMIVNALPFNPLKNPEQMKQLQDEDAGVQFSHSIEEQIGGQLEAGFRLLNIYLFHGVLISVLPNNDC